MDVATWLRCLGLERYESAFRENEIDWEALPKLTAEDLKDLGVVLGGHRRRLLDAIATLGAAEAPPAVTPASVVIGGEAERRQLTIMFCDLVGSTPLSTRYDPEDLREIVGAYHRCVADTVGRFGGFVAKYMGDGVLIYFGYPEAHEDDAERAARAGLAVIDAVGRLSTPEPLNVRIGIASGLVVVGDLIGAGAAQERHRQLAPLRLGCGVRRGTLPARPPPRRARHRPQGLRSLSAAAGDGRSRRRQVLLDRRPSAPAGRAGRSRSRGNPARITPARAPAASPQYPLCRSSAPLRRIVRAKDNA